MNPETVITQVSREDEHTNGHPENGQLPGARVKQPKSRLRCGLRSLLCCFRPRPEPLPPPAPAPSPSLQPPPAGPHPPPLLPPPNGRCLLPPPRKEDEGKPCLVVDLDETLVHSSFKPITNADFIVPVTIDGVVHQVYVLKRPHVDEYLKRIGGLFECVLFTASLAKYADPVADLLDPWGVFRFRLFRESCVFYLGNYVKDLERLGRDLNRVIIVDNSPASYIFNPENALAVKSWFDDMSDTELLDSLPLLEMLSKAKDPVMELVRDRRKRGLASPRLGRPGTESPS